jgi:hypothetical protein
MISAGDGIFSLQWCQSHPILTGAIGSLLTAGIVALFPAGRRFYINLIHWVTRYRQKVPRESIRIAPQQKLVRWFPATVGSEKTPATQLYGRWWVTNILTDRDVLIVGSRIAGYSSVIEQHVMTQHPRDDIYSSEYPIAAGRTTKVTTDHILVPPVTKAGRDFKATLVLIDQFGNEHKARVVFMAPTK